MAANDKRQEGFKSNCWLEKVCEVECEPDAGGDLFSRDWEVFVIKRDERNGKLVGKLACCALAPV